MTTGRLVITFGNNETWDICDEEGIMRSQYGRLCEALESPDSIGAKFFEITGFSNRVDRPPESILVRLEDVKAVSYQTLNSGM